MPPPPHIPRARSLTLRTLQANRSLTPNHNKCSKSVAQSCEGYAYPPRRAEACLVCGRVPRTKRFQPLYLDGVTLHLAPACGIGVSLSRAILGSARRRRLGILFLPPIRPYLRHIRAITLWSGRTFLTYAIEGPVVLIRKRFILHEWKESQTMYCTFRRAVFPRSQVRPMRGVRIRILTKKLYKSDLLIVVGLSARLD